MRLSRNVTAHFASGAITALCVTLLVFLVLRIVPGDPVDLMFGESATLANQEAMRSKLGLDQNIVSQFRHFVSGLAHGDLGQSLTRHKPVATLLIEAAPFSFLLAICSTLIANGIGVPLGAWAALRSRTWPGRVIFFLSLALVSLPAFWLGPLLVTALALRWPWFPISSFDDWAGLILPSLAIGLGLAGYVAQTSRAAIASVLNADFIRTAHAKGLGEFRALFKHALPAAAIPIITVGTLQFGHILAGAVITETIFDWPGMGRLLYDAITQRDYPTVQGIVLAISLFYVVINSLTDLVSERFARQ